MQQPAPWRIIRGDVRKELRKLEANYFDAVFSDPPYGYRFMTRRWDYDVPSVNVFFELLRVMKPGAHALYFGGAKTFHRVAVNVEDAGYEMRDTAFWLYGSGMAKEGDISKDIDEDEGVFAEREVIGKGMSGKTAGMKGIGNSGFRGGAYEITAAASELGKQWEGYSTTLKPAVEPLVLARKWPEGTLVENIKKWGVGALNIPACRVSSKDRWPSNVVLDDAARVMLDAMREGTSEFYYCAKASRRERGEGNPHPTVKPIALTKYFARLLLPPKTGNPRRILVPYSGVASEMIGCVLAGWDEVVGIELSPEYIDFATKRFTRDFGMLSAMFEAA